MTPKQKLAALYLKLDKIENDIVIALAMVQGSISDEKKQELEDILEEDEVVILNNNLHHCAVTLMQFALENELYEACSLLNEQIVLLNPGESK